MATQKKLGTAWRVLFWSTSVLVALVSLRILVIDVETGFAQMLHHLPDRGLAFWAHVLGGAIALGLMPFQFQAGLRARRPIVHRSIGRVYVLAVAIGGVSGLVLSPYSQVNAVAAAGFALLSIAWLVTTSLALRAVLTGQIAAHQRWMLRSAALTFAAVTLRIWLPGSLAAGMPFETAYPIVAWACWLPNLAAVEWYLARSRAPARASAQL